MKKLKFKSPLNYVVTPDSFEEVDQISMTTEGESLTVKELWEKYANGTLKTEAKEGQYMDGEFDDQDWEKVPNLDLTEQDEVSKKLKDTIEVATKTLEDIKKKHREKKSSKSEGADIVDETVSKTDKEENQNPTKPASSDRAHRKVQSSDLDDQSTIQ